MLTIEQALELLRKPISMMNEREKKLLHLAMQMVGGRWGIVRI